jgi:hypothetical protein
MSHDDTIRKGWKVWLLWVTANTAGFGIGIGVSFLTITFVGEIWSIIAFGILAGLAQWFVLRSSIQQAGWWILASTLSAPLSILAANIINDPFLLDLYDIFKIGIGFLAIGLVYGLSQAIVLHNQMRKIGFWVVANLLGWLLGGYASTYSGFLTAAVSIQQGTIFDIIISYSIAGLIVGIVTGIVLVLLLKQPPPQPGKKTSLNWLLASSALTVAVFTILFFWPKPKFDPIRVAEPPDFGSPPSCPELPPMECAGSLEYCTEIVFFEPVDAASYQNYPLNGETWEDQYRSYLRRDLMILVKYASARVACETQQWDYRSFEPIGLGDMSEKNGDIPGTSKGNPGHPAGTHTDGNDMDIAYFLAKLTGYVSDEQVEEINTTGNILRPVCKHTLYGQDKFHCTEPPFLLDPWRTALLITYISQHPQIRVIGVDGQIGLEIDQALDQLVQSGWIDTNTRSEIPMVYEITDQGWGFFNFHHHHMHISMKTDEY